MIGCGSGLLGNQTPWQHSFQAKSSEGEKNNEQKEILFEILALDEGILVDRWWCAK
jgi:hypothetical protein